MTEHADDGDAIVDEVLVDAFPERTVVACDEAGPSWNDDNHTVRVEFADGTFAYLKVAVDGDASRAARERAVLAHVDSNARVPVPAVVASDVDGSRPFLATAAVDGTIGWRAWRDADDDGRATLAHAVGRAFARVHDRPFDGHGRITGGGARDLDVDRQPWPALLVEQIEWSRERADGGRFDHHYDDVLALVDAERDRLRAAPAVLCHGDPARPNQFVHDAERDGPPTVGLLDWELAHVGDPVRELQRARRQFVDSRYDPGTDRHAEAFYDGYRDHAGGLPAGFENRHRLYDAVTYLGVSGFFERWADDVDAPNDELASEVADEMDRRLAAARER